MNARIIISALLVLGAGCASGGNNDAAPTQSTAEEAVDAPTETAATPAPVTMTALAPAPPPSAPEPEEMSGMSPVRTVNHVPGSHAALERGVA